jgi:hypothetical protein
MPHVVRQRRRVAGPDRLHAARRAAARSLSLLSGPLEAPPQKPM